VRGTGRSAELDEIRTTAATAVLSDRRPDARARAARFIERVGPYAGVNDLGMRVFRIPTSIWTSSQSMPCRTSSPSGM
jgi:hypothetical protein